MVNEHKTRSLRLLLSIAVFVTATAFCSITSGQRGTVPRIQITEATQSIVIHAGSHYLLSFNYRVPDLWVGNQLVMTAVPMAPNEIMISGSEPGITSLTVSDEGRRLQPITVHVRNDVRHLQAVMDEQFQSGLIQVSALKNGVVLRGVVASQQQADQAFEIAQDYYPNAVLNQLSLGGNQLVAINVKVYEVARSKLRQLGIDWSFFGEHVTAVQSISGLIQQLGQGTTGATGQTLTFGVFDDNSAFNVFIKTLEQKNLAKLLDEPTLVTSNGRSAEFLSGGEIPIQISTNFGGTSIEYRSFGTKLDIVPTIHGAGELTLEVRAEVSDVASDLAGGGSPGFRVRRVNTGVRMKAGHTLALAGDYREETETIVRGIPGLMDAPVIGAMFRDSQDQKVETELVFLITPKFVDSVDSINTPMPGSSSQPPTTHDLFKHGTVEVESPYACYDPNPFSARNPPAYQTNGLYVPNGVYTPNQLSSPMSNHVPNMYLSPPTNLSPQDYAPLPAATRTRPPSATDPNSPSYLYPPSDDPLLDTPSVKLSDDTLSGFIPVDLNSHPPSLDDPDMTPVRPSDSTVDPLEQKQPEVAPIPKRNEKPELPNPFENRRSNSRNQSQQTINGSFGFSK
jgi:pilus assembly protein CpaC